MYSMLTLTSVVLGCVTDQRLMTVGGVILVTNED